MKHQTSRYEGVTYQPERKRCPWFATLIGHKELRKNSYLGAWETERDAAIAVDRAMLHYGVDLPLHFPAASSKLGPASAAQLRSLAREHLKTMTTSQYRGVSASRDDKWSAYIVHRRERTYLGTFDVEESAARAYDAAASRMHGDKAKLNFP